MKVLVRLLIPAALAAILLTLLMVWGGVGLSDVWSTLRGLPPALYLGALGIHVGIYALRVARYRALLPRDQRPSYGAVMAVSASHNLAAYVLPAKSGEATFVLYLKGLFGVSGVAALASLVVSRLYDFAVLCAALAAATLWLTFSEHWSAPAWSGLAGAASLFVVSGSFLALTLRGERALAPLGPCLRFLRLEGTLLGRRALAFAERAAEALRAARGTTPAPALLLLSGLIWLGVFLFYALLARGFGLPERIGLFEAAFGSGLAVLSNILPINAMAGIGTQEAGWVLGFGLLGVERERAFSTGLAVHLVQLFNVVGMGLLGHLAMGLLPRRAPVDGPGTDPGGPPGGVG